MDQFKLTKELLVFGNFLGENISALNYIEIKLSYLKCIIKWQKASIENTIL